LEGWAKKIDRALKLILWIQFLRLKAWGLAGRFYGAIWLAAAGTVGGSLWLLLAPGRTTRLPCAPVWVVVACPVIILVAYGVGRFVPWGILALAVLIPGTMTLAPSVGRDQRGVFAGASEDHRPVYVGSADLQLFFKGAGTCLCLSAATFLLGALARLPSSRGGKRHWPLRWTAATVLLASGLMGLEMLRVALRLEPEVRVSWLQAVRAVMVEPGWPQALTIWLWLNIAYLLARYDSQLIPYLLRRIGQPWAPNELSIHETYLIDELLRQLTRRPDAQGRHQSRSKKTREQ
jgi:hypothetical protein